jgi:hypothetical protein
MKQDNTVRPGNCLQDSSGANGWEVGRLSEAWDCRNGRRGREFGSAGSAYEREACHGRPKPLLTVWRTAVATRARRASEDG